MSRQVKLVRAVNQSVYREPMAQLPETSPSEEQVRPNSPLEKCCLDIILDQLFEYFRLRGFRMTSGRQDDEERSPLIISIMEENVTHYRCLETLDEIKAAGPEYLTEFYEFVTEYLRMTL